MIIEKTEGNPFFMEETVQVLLDEGALVREGSAVRLTRPLAELKIPPTVQGILAARIDRLPADEKDLLQTLAVIGKEFPLSLVREVLHPHPPDEASGGLSRNRAGEALEGVLSALQLAEFIYEQPAVGDTEYTFKHALTQEVSYNSVLVERRKQLHERAGSAIETLFKDQSDDYLASLAHHYGRSANAMKAAEYLRRAAEQSMERSAYAAAAAWIDDGLRQIGAIAQGAERNRLELRLQILKGQVHQLVSSIGSATSVAAFSRARDLCAQLGDDSELFTVLDGLRWAALFRSEMTRARELAEELGASGFAELLAHHCVDARIGFADANFRRFDQLVEQFDDLARMKRAVRGDAAGRVRRHIVGNAAGLEPGLDAAQRLDYLGPELAGQQRSDVAARYLIAVIFGTVRFRQRPTDLLSPRRRRHGEATVR